MSEKTAAEKIAEIEARRKQARKDRDDKRNEQKLIDLAAIEELEIELGDAIAIVEIPDYTPGCVTMVAARCPTTPEIKRYRHMATDKPGKRNEIVPGDKVEAAETIAECCLKYPTRDEFAKVCDAKPGLKAQLGTLAVTLVVGDAKS